MKVSSLKFQQEFSEVLESSANIANKVNSKVSILALLGLLASGSIAWLLYSQESSLFWNGIKCGVVLLPAIITCFIWRTLANIINAPDHFSSLINDDNGLVSNVKSLCINKPNSFRGLLSTIRSIRNEESLAEIMDALSGVLILANPLFLILAFISITILLMLIIISPFMVIFY